MSGRRTTCGSLAALVLILGALVVSDEGFATPVPAADDSLQYWLDLLHADDAAIDSLFATLDEPPPAAPSPRGWDWSGALSTGYDTYVQTYALALEDTTESLSEYEVNVSAVGEARATATGTWRLAPSLALGSERIRSELESDWSWNPDDGAARVVAGVELRDVRYRGTTDWNLSSDWREADVDLRWRRELDAVATDLAFVGTTLRYADPSELEVDRDDLRATFALKSSRAAASRWKLGVRAGRRAHPDTAAIDRTMWGTDAEYEITSTHGPSLRLQHRGERREVRDETVRPSSWSHWGSAAGSVPLSQALEACAELDGEVWTYDLSAGAYQNQHRWSGAAGVRAAALDGPSWQLGLAWERLQSDDADESYTQQGVRAGLDAYGSGLTASLTLEVGRRDYGADQGDDSAVEDPIFTDFTYVELWLDVSWRLHGQVSLDVMGSWLPETHRQNEDDQSLGFGSVRLSYRF